MTISSIRHDLQSGTRTIAEIIEGIYQSIARRGDDSVWIFLRPQDEVLREALSMDSSLPLFGIPFAVKDNIDVAGIPTTAACPAFAFIPSETAFVVQKLRDAGALLIGKTNMDQFATGLVGTRTPHGACRNVFHPEFISGGSSSGSAVAVAAGLVAFSLGTDTAGSGRVPAAFNNIVGLKPTRGLLSLRGILPACASLDCPSIFANTVEDALSVLDVAAGFDGLDPWSRKAPRLPARADTVCLGVPEKLEFFGDAECEQLFTTAVKKFRAKGWDIVPVNFEPFLEAARLLYEGPWVAERDHSVGDFIRRHPGETDPIVRQIIVGGVQKSAVEAFDGIYKLQRLRSRTEAVWSALDALLVPTVPTIYRVEEVMANPIVLNSRLGTYTNFVNLLDLSALAVPAGFRSDGLPFGVSLVGPAFEDRLLAWIATGTCVGRGMVQLAVVGAHLSGQPLNYQLTNRRAVLRRTTTTSSHYRLHALPTQPPKPGLVRRNDGGQSIEVEVWDVPVEDFGSFVDLVPAPLAIGSLELADGSWVKGFVCEPEALESSPDISRHLGWRAYLSSSTP